MKKPRSRLASVSLICRFCKSVSGRINNHGQSLLEHAVDCLNEIGIERTQPMRARAFVELHLDAIHAHLGKSPIQSKRVVSAGAANDAASIDVKSDAFLSTYAWRRLRMRVLKRDGAKCACCGATPATGAVMNVDHIKPRRLFPDLALDENNLQVLCDACNHGKGNWDQTDWRDIA